MPADIPFKSVMLLKVIILTTLLLNPMCVVRCEVFGLYSALFSYRGHKKLWQSGQLKVMLLVKKISFCTQMQRQKIVSQHVLL